MKMESDIPSKPPLFHWLGAFISIVWGDVTEATVRFPSALLATLGILAVYFLGRKLFGPEIGLLGGVILATSMEYQHLAISARVDMTLTLFVTFSLVLFFALYRGYLTGVVWNYVFYLILGVGVLAKGPISLILSGMVIVCFLALRKRWNYLYRLIFHRGAILTVMVALSWYVLALVEGGEEFFNRQIMHENLSRFFISGEGGSGHQKPIYYYLPYLFSEGLPWSLFFPFLLVEWFKGRRFADEGFLFLAVWAVVVFVFFSLSAGKRPPYILPLYPPLSLLVAVWFHRSNGVGKGEKLGLRLLGAGSLAVGVVLLVSTLRWVWDGEPAWFLSAVVPLLKPKDQANLLIVKEGLVRAGWIFTLFMLFSSLFWISLSHGLWTLRIRTLPSRLALISLFSGFLAQNVLIPSIAKARSYSPFMQEVNRLVKGGRVYLFSGAFDSGQVVFYRGKNIPVLQWTPQKLAQNLRTTGSYFIMSERDWQKMDAMKGPLPAALLKSKGSGPDGKAHLVLIRGRAIGVAL
ncbi:MAG: glycosyltransferase family 39 protein [Deltaproteobacteria bacterium]|nr:glycosyltransferase family 39 protein [Deltaproteobacteria bacterium]